MSAWLSIPVSTGVLFLDPWSSTWSSLAHSLKRSLLFFTFLVMCGWQCSEWISLKKSQRHLLVGKNFITTCYARLAFLGCGQSKASWYVPYGFGYVYKTSENLSESMNFVWSIFSQPCQGCLHCNSLKWERESVSDYLLFYKRAPSKKKASTLNSKGVTRNFITHPRIDPN